MSIGRIDAYNIKIDPLTMNEAVTKCISLSKQRYKKTNYVVTPNVNHIVLLDSDEELRQSYNSASLVLIDGKPVKWSLQILGHKIQEVVPGSSLTMEIFDKVNASENTSVFLLGAKEGVAMKAASVINNKWPNISVRGYYSPPIGFEKDQHECEKIVKLVNRSNPDILVIGLGAPKQEIWIHKNSQNLNVGLALCVGATIDFISGDVKRAPLWMQKIGLEWLFRVYSEPRRLFLRYIKDGIRFPVIFLRHCLQK
ncbi:MAG: WecB/TagA/CpsF family glycosyltransferase [Candidatus Thiodiazotropha taylori]